MVSGERRPRNILSPSKVIAIVAALHREVSALVKHWRIEERTYAGGTFRFYENENAVLICGGIGPEAARRAAEAAIALYNPNTIYSAGFAGAADPNSRVGDILIPCRVIDSSDGSRTDTETGEGILVSFAIIANPQQKAKLRTAYNADAIDMEAAAVAKAAAAHGIRFAAVKSISDPSDFALPALDKFVGTDGTFSTRRFVLFAIPRPWMWPQIARLQKNSAHAARTLCDQLRRIAAGADVLFQLPIAKEKAFDRQ
jgi:adenosylhomocysteine nucleosidase